MSLGFGGKSQVTICVKFYCVLPLQREKLSWKNCVSIDNDHLGLMIITSLLGYSSSLFMPANFQLKGHLLCVTTFFFRGKFWQSAPAWLLLLTQIVSHALTTSSCLPTLTSQDKHCSCQLNNHGSNLKHLLCFGVERKDDFCIQASEESHIYQKFRLG